MPANCPASVGSCRETDDAPEERIFPSPVGVQQCRRIDREALRTCFGGCPLASIARRSGSCDRSAVFCFRGKLTGHACSAHGQFAGTPHAAEHRTEAPQMIELLRRRPSTPNAHHWRLPPALLRLRWQPTVPGLCLAPFQPETGASVSAQYCMGYWTFWTLSWRSSN